MRITSNGLTFTSGERVVLAMAWCWRGLRQMVQRTGFWSKKSRPGLPASFPETAERLLMRFGDLKMGAKEISNVCAWAMDAVDEEVFSG